MARNLGDMVVSIKGDSSSLDSTIDKSEKKLDAFGNTAGSVGKIFTTGAFAAGAAAAIMAFNRIRAEVDKVEAAWQAQAEASAILGNVLKTTGAEAWTTQDALEGLASQLQKTTKYADENIIAMQSVLLGFRNITGKEFDEATKAVLDMATVMKMDLTSAAQAVGKALDNPIQGLDSLSRQGFKFTEQEKEMMKAMVEAGNIAGAQKIILDELAKTYGGAAEKAGELEVALKTKLKNAVGELDEELGRATSRTLAPFRQWLIDIATNAAEAAKQTNNLVDAFKNIKAGVATVDEQLLFETSVLKNLKEVREQAKFDPMVSKEEKDALDEAIKSQELRIQGLKDQKTATDNLAKATTDAQTKQAKSDKETADAKVEQARIDKARTDIVLEYQNTLKDIDRQEKIGLLTAEEAGKKRDEALVTEIEALNDLIKTEKLRFGTTINLRNAEEKRFASIKKGIKVEKEQKETNDEINAQLTGQSSQERIDALDKETAAQIEGLRAGVALIEQNNQIQDQVAGQSHDERIKALDSETAKQIESLNEGVKIIQQNEAIQDQIAGQDHDERIKALEAETAKQIEGLNEGVKLIKQNEAIQDQIAGQEHAERISAMDKEIAEQIAGLRAGAEVVKQNEDIQDQIAGQDHAERIAAMEKETAEQIAGLQAGVELIKQNDEIQDQIAGQAHDERIAAMTKETEEQVKALQEGVARLETEQEITDAVASQVRIKALEDEVALQIAGLREGVKRLEQEQKITDADNARWLAAAQGYKTASELAAKYRASQIDDYATIAESGVSGFNKILDAANSMFTETGDLSASFIGDMTSGLGEVVSTFNKEAGTVLQVMGNLQNSVQQALNDFVDSIVGNDERIADAFESANNTLIDLRIEGIEKGLDAELNAIDEATNKRLESLGYIDEVGTDLIQKRYDAELDAIDAREAAELAALGIVEETESDRLQKRIDAINQELTEEISARERAILEQELAELTSAKTIADVKAGYEAERDAAAKKAAEEKAARDAIELEAAKAKAAAEEAAQVQLRKYNRDKAIADKAISLAQAKISEQKALADLGWFNWGKKDEVKALYAQIYSAINAIPLPALAQGGIAMPQSGGQVVNVAEAGVPEAILPLDRLDEVLESVGDRSTPTTTGNHWTFYFDSQKLFDEMLPASQNGQIRLSSRAIVNK